MEVKPGYKLTEVGVIPEDWVCSEIGELALRVGSGITPTGGEKIYKKYGKPFVRSQNVGWGTLLLDDLAFIDNHTHESFQASEIKQGDVLLNITGASIGRSAVADTRLNGGNVNQHVCEIRPCHRLDSYYLNNYLLSVDGQRQIDSFQAGGNRQGLNYQQVRSFLIPLPPLPEQTAIATTLSDVDSLISSLDALIAKKKQIKQGAMQELLSGKRRLPGFSGEWEVKRLGDVAVLHKENVIPNATPDKTFTHFSLPSYDQGKEPVVELGLSIGSNKFRVISGAVLISKLNPRIPRIWVPLVIPEDSVASTEFLVLTPKECITRNYLYVLLTSPRLQEQMELAATGTTGSHQRIGPEHVLKLVLHVPNAISEQQAIATILSDMDAEISALEARRNKTRLLKQGMMQELLTGRIRLPMEHSTVSVRTKPTVGMFQ